MALKISCTFKPVGDAAQSVWWGFHPLLQITRSKYLPKVQAWNPWRMSRKSQRSKRYTKNHRSFSLNSLEKINLNIFRENAAGGKFPEQLQGSDLAAPADVKRSGAGRACVRQDPGVGRGQLSAANQH